MEHIGPHGIITVDMTTDGVVVLADTTTNQRMSLTPDEVEGFVRWLARSRGIQDRTFRPLPSVLDAAERLLGARRDDMLTIEETVALARAVAACNGRRTAQLLTPGDLDVVARSGVAWDEAVDGPLTGDGD